MIQALFTIILIAAMMGAGYMVWQAIEDEIRDLNDDD